MIVPALIFCRVPRVPRLLHPGSLLFAVCCLSVNGDHPLSYHEEVRPHTREKSGTCGQIWKEGLFTQNTEAGDPKWLVRDAMMCNRRAQETRVQQLHRTNISLSARMQMYVCMTQMVLARRRHVCRRTLVTFSWQLTVPPASRRCLDSSVTRASMSHVVQHTRCRTRVVSLVLCVIVFDVTPRSSIAPAQVHSPELPKAGRSGGCPGSKIPVSNPWI